MAYYRDRDERESEREGDLLVKCAHCSGDGWNYGNYSCCARHNGLEPDSNRRMKCCACNGRGVIPT